MSANNSQELVEQLKQMVLSASSDANISNSDLRRVLRFVSKVVQVVNQAFQNVYPLLIEIKFLRPEDLHTEKHRLILKELDLLCSRDYYRDIQLICGQLRELEQQYTEQIQPIVNKLNPDGQDDFSQVFSLLEHHEGYILMIMQDLTYNLVRRLEQVDDATELQNIKIYAGDRAREIKKSLTELQLIGNKILGLSGKEGFLELTQTDRLQLRDEIRYDFNIVDNSIRTGDVSGQQVAIGRDIAQSVHTETHTGLDAKQVQLLLDELIREVRKEGLPATAEAKVIKQLEISKDELNEENPDKDYIGKNLQKVTDTMVKAGTIIDQSSSIGLRLLKLGKWIGTAIAFL
ncbi:hypothetical protein GGR28_003590 [Lewinella aquimaris]|uniref:Uncharacterized protein n=1 Tax=Neolewinella aquimaris TaxID=1835722 RepID=A0A840E708_9BACT|nr:hypothetical protein [Neolewinella aquimaris]MBB4080951.1 hypothetical protein [Neolewinella aquimaris]